MIPPNITPQKYTVVIKGATYLEIREMYVENHLPNKCLIFSHYVDLIESLLTVYCTQDPIRQ